MPRTRTPYPADFRDQIIALARSGRSVESLAREFEPCAATIAGWIRQAGIDAGVRDDGPTSLEREELARLRKENRQLRMERDILKGCGLVCSGRARLVEVFKFMTVNQAVYPVQLMAKVLGVSRSGFYAWQRRAPSTRSVADAALSIRIAEIHTVSKQTYGAPRIHAELADEGSAWAESGSRG